MLTAGRSFKPCFCRPTKLAAALAVAGLLITGNGLRAQDAHYWTQQYGPFMVKSARLTVGAGYGWGSSPAEGLTDVLGDDDLDPRYVYSRFRALFGFELGVR